MNPPANWYPDPTGRHGQRYWDGEQWTEHVFTDGVQAVDPLEQAAAATSEASTDDHPAEDGMDTAADEAPADEAPADEAPADEAADHEAPADEAPAEGAADDGPVAGRSVDADAVNGLFEEANGQEAWTPHDEEAQEDAAAVAPDMEAEDVVASLDEVGDGAQGDTEGSEPAPAVGDMSDAFVLAPETASRIVKRRTPEAGDEPLSGEPTAAAPAAAPSETEEEAATGTGAIDAPPPTADAPPAAMPAPTAAAPTASTAGPTGAPGELGITGDLLGGAFAERSGAGPVALQNSRLLRCSVAPGDAVVARQGTMVAYQGDVSFDRQGAGGVARALKRAATGEGLAMMRAEGSGDVFFADGAQHVFLLQLAGGPGLSVNGRNVLAFSAALAWDIERVKGASLLAGGLFNTTFTGTGWVALVSDGEPVVLHTDEARTHVDVNALVAWSAGLSTEIVSSVSAKSLVGLGSGEAFQMAFDGPGIVIVQPSEGPLGGAAAT